MMRISVLTRRRRTAGVRGMSNDNIIGALHSDGKRRLREAKQKSMKDEADPDELLMSVLGTRYESWCLVVEGFARWISIYMGG